MASLTLKALVIFTLFQGFTSAGATDMDAWPVKIDAYFMNRVPCIDSESDAISEQVKNDPDYIAGTKNPIDKAVAGDLEIEVCAVLRIKRDFMLEKSPICPGMNVDNFHICYERTLFALSRRNGLSIPGLMMMQFIPTMYAMRQKERHPENKEKISLALGTSVLATIRNMKHVRLPGVSAKMVPSSPGVQREIEARNQFETLLVRKTVQQLMPRADSLIKVRSGRTPSADMNTISAWRRSLESEVEAAKRDWKYPDPTLESELAEARKKLKK